MRRREFITLLGGAAALPLAARAQQAPKVARIGYMVTGSLHSADQRPLVDAFRQGLRESGYVEGQNIVVGQKSRQSGGGAAMPDNCRQVRDFGVVGHCQP